MDSYFRSVGFSRLKTKGQIKKLNDEVLDTPDSRYILSKNSDNILIEYYKEYAPDIGVSLKGEMDEKEDVVIKNLKPYAFTENIIKINDIEIEKIDEDYYAVCEDMETGNEFVFYIQNALDFVDSGINQVLKKVNMVGLSKLGTIILPIRKNNEYRAIKEEESRMHRELLKRAKHGDSDAEKQLIIHAQETDKLIKERLKEEDFLSVVEGYFLPDDSDESKYTVLGEIIDIKLISNDETNEKIYIFMLNITGTKIEICINKKDVIGHPTVGMRFMGQCWLQGKVLF